MEPAKTDAELLGMLDVFTRTQAEAKVAANKLENARHAAFPFDVTDDVLRSRIPNLEALLNSKTATCERAKSEEYILSMAVQFRVRQALPPGFRIGFVASMGCYEISVYIYDSNDVQRRLCLRKRDNASVWHVGSFHDGKRGTLEQCLAHYKEEADKVTQLAAAKHKERSEAEAKFRERCKVPATLAKLGFTVIHDINETDESAEFKLLHQDADYRVRLSPFDDVSVSRYTKLKKANKDGDLWSYRDWEYKTLRQAFAAVAEDFKKLKSKKT